MIICKCKNVMFYALQNILYLINFSYNYTWNKILFRTIWFVVIKTVRFYLRWNIWIQYQHECRGNDYSFTPRLIRPYTDRRAKQFSYAILARVVRGAHVNSRTYRKFLIALGVRHDEPKKTTCNNPHAKPIIHTYPSSRQELCLANSSYAWYEFFIMQ